MFSAGRVTSLLQPLWELSRCAMQLVKTVGIAQVKEERKKKTLCYIRNMINVWDEYPLHQINIPLLSRVHTTTF